MRVLDERPIQPRLQRIGLVDDGLHVVGDHRGEHTTEETPCRLEPGDHIIERLAVREPHETEPGHDRREHQRPQIPLLAGLRIGDAAELAEVDLQLITRRPVVHPDRRVPDRAADAEFLERVAVQRPLGHDHALALQQLVDLDDRKPVLVLAKPLLELVSVRIKQPARFASAVGAMGPHALDDLAQQHVGHLLLAAGPIHTELDRSVDVTTDRLTVHPHQLTDRTLTLPT